jgi:uroporphyrinogen III methyltransferase / synthase
MRIVVTRADAQADELARGIEELGHEAVRCPLIRVEPLGDEPIDLAPYDWVVVTSPNGAGELARRLVSPPAKLAAIGPGTAEELRRRGLEPDLVPQVSTQEGLLAELPGDARILLAAAEGARRLLPGDFLPLYRTVELARDAPPEGDLAILMSPSAARAYARVRGSAPVIAIGPQTAAEAEAQGLTLRSVAKSHDLDGILDEIRAL